MGTRIIITLLLIVPLNYLYGQADLNESIIEFKSNCSEPIIPEDTVAEFTLLELTTNDNFATLNFEIIVNCAQQKKGLVSIEGDTLTILGTDVTISRTIRYEELDSAGLRTKITEETHIAEFAFCDCLMKGIISFQRP